MASGTGGTKPRDIMVMEVVGGVVATLADVLSGSRITAAAVWLQVQLAAASSSSEHLHRAYQM